MTESKNPETFIVGETVEFCHREDNWPVTVTAVDGDKVTAEIGKGWEIVFTPRADGKHVAQGTHEFAVMPDIIFHLTEPRTEFVPQRSFLDRILDRFF